MTQQHLKPDEVEMFERAEKATKGPWTTDKYERPDWEPDRKGGSVRLGRRYDVDDLLCVDSAFIAAARTDLPTILTRLANERARLAIAMEALKRFTAFEPLADAALCRIEELEKQHGKT